MQASLGCRDQLHSVSRCDSMSAMHAGSGKERPRDDLEAPTKDHPASTCSGSGEAGQKLVADGSCVRTSSQQEAGTTNCVTFEPTGSPCGLVCVLLLEDSYSHMVDTVFGGAGRAGVGEKAPTLLGNTLQVLTTIVL